MPRYRVISDSSKGIYNLRITSVTIEDEGEYQCQVGPAQNQLPIRASSHVTVIGKCKENLSSFELKQIQLSLAVKIIGIHLERTNALHSLPSYDE